MLSSGFSLSIVSILCDRIQYLSDAASLSLFLSFFLSLSFSLYLSPRAFSAMLGFLFIFCWSLDRIQYIYRVLSLVLTSPPFSLFCCRSHWSDGVQGLLSDKLHAMHVPADDALLEEAIAVVSSGLTRQQAAVRTNCISSF